jgi:hypothetical protein
MLHDAIGPSDLYMQGCGSGVSRQIDNRLWKLHNKEVCVEIFPTSMHCG